MQASFFTSKDSKLFCNTPLHFTLTNRYNGISLPPYDSLNLAYHVNDIQSNVLQNRAYIMQKYYKDKTLLYLNQIHSNIIFTTKYVSKHTESNSHNLQHSKEANIESKKDFLSISQECTICKDFSKACKNNEHIESISHSFNLKHTKKHKVCKSHIQKYKYYSEALVGQGDGMICDNPNLVLMSMVADCNPILVYSPIKNVFALLHAGRIGVCQKILTHAILLLKSNYGVDLCDILVFIGASIRKCCYIIGKDLAMQIINEFGAKHVIYDGNQYRLDMIGLLRDELSELGVTYSQVEIHDCCTCCNEAYFSYRREGLTGRFGLFASLN